MSKLFKTRTEAEANKILTQDPKNPFKLWIKHRCLKTKYGTKFYYYMHKLNLMYGQVTRMLMLFALALAGLVRVGFWMAQQPDIVALLGIIAINAMWIVVVIVIGLGLAFLATWAFVIFVSLFNKMLEYIWFGIENIIAALFF